MTEQPTLREMLLQVLEAGRAASRSGQEDSPADLAAAQFADFVTRQLNNQNR